MTTAPHNPTRLSASTAPPLVRLPAIVRALYSVVADLETMFPGRRFTPDGHMVGSLGECLAAHHYGLDLLPASAPGHDALKGELRVQVKATQGTQIGLRSEPDHLLVLRLDGQGGFEEIYNGPGKPVWDVVKSRPRPSNGQYQVTVGRLRQMAAAVPPERRLVRSPEGCRA